jgi:hypothetical protein
MMKADNGGPAFPCKWVNDGDANMTAPDGQVCPPGYEIQLSGMSLRDYFAALALEGNLAACDREITPHLCAKFCYEIADAMLAERSK